MSSTKTTTLQSSPQRARKTSEVKRTNQKGAAGSPSSSSNIAMPCIAAQVQNIMKRRDEEMVQPHLDVITVVNNHHEKLGMLGMMHMMQCGLNAVVQKIKQIF